MRPWVIMAQNYSHLLWEVTNFARTQSGTLRSLKPRNGD